MIVRLESPPQVMVMVEGYADEARLLDDIDGRNDLPAEIAAAVGEEVHAMRAHVRTWERGDVA